MDFIRTLGVYQLFKGSDDRSRQYCGRIAHGPFGQRRVKQASHTVNKGTSQFKEPSDQYCSE